MNTKTVHDDSRVGDWIQTHSGRAIYPLGANEDEITIDDIAHALSNQCRFTGHTSEFYSVAEHCVHVSELCDEPYMLWGLLHDATEAYLVDLARPIKHDPTMFAYREAEDRLMTVICHKFGLTPGEPENVKYVDKLILSIEARDLMAPLRPGWERWLNMIGDCPLRIVNPWSPAQAKRRFLDRYTELKAEQFFGPA